MDTQTIDVHSQEYLEAMAALMSEAVETPEGLRALAAAIADPIAQEIDRKEISSLLLTKHTLPKGERPVYQKRPTLNAYWISEDGEAREQEVGRDEVEFPTGRVHSAPMVDVSVLKHGNIGTLLDIQESAATEIRKTIDARTVSVISAAVLAEGASYVTRASLFQHDNFVQRKETSQNVKSELDQIDEVREPHLHERRPGRKPNITRERW